MTRIRLLVLALRPPVLLLAAVYLALGAAATGEPQRVLPLLIPAAAVLAILLFSLRLNDLADEAIDRVNLPANPQRSLVVGRRGRRTLALGASTWASIALGLGALLGLWSLVIVALTLLVSTAYSLPPTRLAARGLAAALVLPACFVAAPYFLGWFAVGGTWTSRDGVLLLGLYLGFVGRILLKDFRDVRGDALFGKRTFLVRRGRVATCRTAAVFWAVGTALASAAAPDPQWAFWGSIAACLAVALVLLRALSGSAGHRRDETLISALAIVGRGTVVVPLAQISAVAAGWTAAATAAAVLAIAAVTLGQAHHLLRHGPSAAPWERDWDVVAASRTEPGIETKPA